MGRNEPERARPGPPALASTLLPLPPTRLKRAGRVSHRPRARVLDALALLGCCPLFLRAPSGGSRISPRTATGFPAGCSVSPPWCTPSPIGLQASEPPSGTRRRARWRLRGPHPPLVVQGVEGRSGHTWSSVGPLPLLEGAWHGPGPLPHQERASFWADPTGGRGRMEAGSRDTPASSSDPLSGPCLQRCTRTQAKALPGSALRRSPPAGLCFLKVAVGLHRPEPSLPALEGAAGGQGLLEWVQRAPPREPRLFDGGVGWSQLEAPGLRTSIKIQNLLCLGPGEAP